MWLARHCAGTGGSAGRCPVSPKAANVRFRLRVIFGRSGLLCESMPGIGHAVVQLDTSCRCRARAVTLPSLGDVAGYNLALHIFAMSIG